MTTRDNNTCTAWIGQPPYKTALDAAQRLHWSVLPLAKTKKPHVQWKEYQKKAAASHVIATWQQELSPMAWAVVTGSVSNLIILDFDGEEGQETLERLRLQPHLRTGSGGHHAYFHHPGWRVKTLNHQTSKDRPWSKLYPGMDIRADGGYAAFCGKNAKGPYIWLRSPEEPNSLDLLPEDLRELLGLLHAPDPTAEQSLRPKITVVSTRPKTHDQGEYILEKYLSEIFMRRGRDNACFQMACQLRDNGFSQAEAERYASQFANRAGNTNTKGEDEPFTPQEALLKVASAYGEQAREPWSDTRHNHNGLNGKNGSRNNSANTQQAAETGIDLCQFDADDSGNGDAMYALYGTQFLWSSARGWFIYNGRYWKFDPNGDEVRKKAVTALRLRRHAAVDQEKEAIIKCTKADDKRVSGCVNRFRTLVGISLDEFDNNPNLLNCNNGVVNLRDGSIEEHTYKQRFTYCLSVNYEKADCTDWTNFLQTVVDGGQEVLDYLQELAGYSLTGHTNEELLVYLHGPTRAGKGTFAEVFQALLPDPIARGVDFNSFTTKREGDVSNFDLAPLKPSRMIFASESQKSQSLNPQKIKQLTGGDPVTCCFKHRDFFTYKPQFKVWMLSNWTVNGDPEDDALWGRVRVITFPTSFLGKEDKSLKARLKTPEALKGILYWTVQGAIKWHTRGSEGLVTPDAVKTKTQEHRNDLDYVQKWLDECGENGTSEDWTPNEIVTASYLSWCRDNGVQHPKGPKALAQSLKAKGYTPGMQKKQGGKNKKGVQGLIVTFTDESDKEGNDSVTGNGCNGRNQESLFKEKIIEKSQNQTLQPLPVTESLPLTGEDAGEEEGAVYL